MLTHNWSFASFDGFIKTVLAALNGTTHASGVVVTAGGSGYAVGDQIAISGSLIPVDPTAIQNVVLEVTEVSGSSVTGIRVIKSGICTASAGYINLSLTGGLEVTVTMSDTGWDLQNSPVAATSAMTYSIANAGSGYAVSNKIYVAGASAHNGTNPIIHAAFFNVDSVDGSGAITGLSVFDHPSSDYFGLYENLESGVHDLSGGTGTGAQVNLAIPSSLPTEPGSVYVFRNRDTGSQFALHRADDFLAGAYFSVGLFSMPTYDGTANLYEQDDVTPGYAVNGDWAGASGAFLHSTVAAGTAYMTISDRAVTIVIENETADFSMYAGFLNQFSVTSGTNFPMCIYASGTDPEFVTLGTDGGLGGLAEPAHATAATPPGQVWDGSAWQGFSNAAISGGSLDYSTYATSGRGTWPNMRPLYTGSVDEPTALSNDDLTAATPWRMSIDDGEGGTLPLPLPITLVRQSTPSLSLGEMAGPLYLPTNTEVMYPEDHAIEMDNGDADWADYYDDTQHVNADGMSSSTPRQILSTGILEIKHTDPNSPAYTNLHLTRGSRIIMRDTGLINTHESAGDYFAIVVQDPDVDKADFGSTITLPLATGSLTTHFLGAVYWAATQSGVENANHDMVALLKGGGATATKSFTGLTAGYFGSGFFGAEIPIGTLVIEYGFDGKLRVMYNDSATYLAQDDWVSYDDWSTTGTGFKVESVPTYYHDRLDIALVANDPVVLKENRCMFSYDRLGNAAYPVKHHLSKQTGRPRPYRGDTATLDGHQYKIFASGIRQEPTSHYMVRTTS